MTIGHQLDALIAALDETAQDVISFFTGLGANSRVRVGVWGPQEVLSHFLFWHESTVQGMESVADGRGPYLLEAPTDDLNARAVAEHSGKTVAELVAQFQALQKRMVLGVRTLPDPEIGVMRRLDGTLLSGPTRLEMITRHLREHMEALREETGQKT